ncbi:MAG: polysaccharide biosynthesis tyrosine autokinase, partial [Deltaproteobacteria bacterium]|nr:polysaccharide biosynthesis tyrosine autokinase [Deltaproteobacteria bacterium]MBN2674053.1 polysaccharide biosynthesis tyrosine autokinase [Deltaproteobacteria bacterium]
MSNSYDTHDDNSEALSITDLLAILLDDWRLVVGPAVLVILLAGVYLVMAVPRYQAFGILQVSTEDTSSASAILELSGMSAPSVSETEVEILKSQRIMQHAANQLNLNIHQPISSYTMDLGVTLKGKSPLNDDVRQLRKCIGGLRIADWVEQPVGAVFQLHKNGRLQVELDGVKRILAKDQMFSAKGVSMVYRGDGKMQVGEEISVAIIPNDQLVDSLRTKLSVTTIGGRKDTSLVKITFEHVDRALAKAYVNHLMDAYMDFALDWQTDRADKSAAFIEKQMDSIRKSLENTEEHLQKFLEESGAVMLPDQAKVLIEEGSKMDIELKKLRIQEDLMKQVSFQIEQAKKKGNSVSLTGDFIFEDELMVRAVSTLNELQLKREALLADFTPNHPQIVRLNAEIQRVHDQISNYVRGSRKRITERREAIDDSLEGIQEELAQFPEKERALSTLRRNQEVGQELYTFLMTKLEESRIMKASTTTDKRIIDGATTPYKKSFPKRKTVILMAAFLGILLGVAAVFVRRAIDPKVRDEEEAKNAVSLPVYGTIPNLKILGFDEEKGPMVNQIWDAPKGPGAESFRTLRTNIEFSQTTEKPVKVIQVTSSEAGEGKSTVLSNLAVSLAKAGNSVILADLDLRRPTQHRVWGVLRSPGISNFLSGRDELKRNDLEKWGVTVVSAGYEPPESQRLLASTAFQELLDKWREEYDYILLDAPPLLVADALVISKLCDLLLYVVRPKVVRRTALKMAQSTYSKMTLIKGLVVNGAVSRKGGYYHYYRGSYYGSKTTDTQES